MLGNQRVAQLIQARRLTPQGKTIFPRQKPTVGGPLIQRGRGRSEEESKNVAPSLAAFDAANPGIIAVLSFEQLKVWHDVIAGWAHNRKVGEALVRHEKRERSKMLDPTSTRPIISSDYLDERARI
jgi:hypothetical protein